MAHVLCTFNVNNLYARYRLSETYPGDQARKSAAEAGWTYLPLDAEHTVELFNETQRELAAKVLCKGKKAPTKKDFPDILCLQEVESVFALRKFNKDYLKDVYPYRILLDAHDIRQIDVAVLSKVEITRVRTHMDDPDPTSKSAKESYLFSRDCLEVDFALNKSGSSSLTLFVNHLKSKYSKSAKERADGDAKRKRQAAGVVEIVKQRFPNLKKGWYAIAGDMNDTIQSKALAPLMKGTPFVDALARIKKPEDRWTYWYNSENQVTQIDNLLLSPELDQATKGNIPEIERRGIGFSRYLVAGGTGPRTTEFHAVEDDPNPVVVDFQFPRFAEVSPENRASDHCPVFLEIP